MCYACIYVRMYACMYESLLPTLIHYVPMPGSVGDHAPPSCAIFDVSDQFKCFCFFFPCHFVGQHIYIYIFDLLLLFFLWIFQKLQSSLTSVFLMAMSIGTLTKNKQKKNKQKNVSLCPTQNSRRCLIPVISHCHMSYFNGSVAFRDYGKDAARGDNCCPGSLEIRAMVEACLQFGT